VKGPEKQHFAQGACWRDDDPEGRAAAIEAAFDYRGDVTLFLADGTEVKGYVANRLEKPGQSYIDLLPADGSAARRIGYEVVCGIAFTGKDTAAGKSWETWMKNWHAKQEARARGEAVEPIGLFPDGGEGD
jgi:hypothetical protein